MKGFKKEEKKFVESFTEGHLNPQYVCVDKTGMDLERTISVFFLLCLSVDYLKNAEKGRFLDFKSKSLTFSYWERSLR